MSRTSETSDPSEPTADGSSAPSELSEPSDPVDPSEPSGPSDPRLATPIKEHWNEYPTYLYPALAERVDDVWARLQYECRIQQDFEPEQYRHFQAVAWAIAVEQLEAMGAAEFVEHCEQLGVRDVGDQDDSDDGGSLEEEGGIIANDVDDDRGELDHGLDLETAIEDAQNS
ncbi:hypothetical protein SAMN05443661_102206 [Natronobacterium gregoryi]|uniref:Uncharacterized protein n=3 Tax=Natronobacterium gregoryi TaxID=44930 RepID=L0AJ25_NATGS|nr:hypothetical protein Natgr_1875 [Natronobacterium gregoryi SP2]ELY70838.1 hypothetical protein C490_06092 [Natronobacterium gregoryi SP2]PLK20419.1 hypothetical protein CYV19_09840 [Natronobacterium gregoryi SP2]SFI62300.1 hypothetical protein SAMN05443661_102206 [Natronobacterium gregoryi]